RSLTVISVPLSRGGKGAFSPLGHQNPRGSIMVIRSTGGVRAFVFAFATVLGPGALPLLAQEPAPAKPGDAPGSPPPATQVAGGTSPLSPIRNSKFFKDLKLMSPGYDLGVRFESMNPPDR